MQKCPAWLGPTLPNWSPDSTHAQFCCSNSLSCSAGTFPAWLVTNVPQLVTSCQCSVGVNLDGPKFSCPKSLPRLTRQAQTILHRFESLQCITDDKTLTKGVDERQLIPVYYLTAGPGQRPMLSRAEHKQQVLQWHMAEQQQGQQQQGQHWQKRHRQRAAAGVVVGVLAAVALAAAAVMVVMRGRQQGWQSTGREVGGGITCYGRCNHTPIEPPATLETAAIRSRLHGHILYARLDSEHMFRSLLTSGVSVSPLP